ncbi:MAG: HAMP domain-containing histidine kinase [Anaerolineales bacterium]|nr:HAMP domain-containing histidine kinase [Anaerolineales bacterium]
MSLLQQFITVSLFPLSLLGLLVYFGRSGVAQRGLAWRWALTLLLAVVLASSVMRLYGWGLLPARLIYAWGILGSYALVLTALGLLLTTLAYLSTPSRRGLVIVGVSLPFLAASFALDPALWGAYLPAFQLAGQQMQQFDLWGAVWITAWLLPTLAAWLLTQQTSTLLPISLYRNKITYWSLMLLLYAVGSVFSSIKQPFQPIWQEIGLLFIIPALTIGTISIVRSQLPDLLLAWRQLLRRVAGTLIIFGLTWLALWFITERLAELDLGLNPSLQLGLIAALFAGFFTLTYRLVSRLTRRLFLPSVIEEAQAITDYTNLIGYLPQPERLGKLFLNIIQARFGVSSAWLLQAEDGPGGMLLLRPLTAYGTPPPDVIHFSAASPFARYLRHNQAPLVQYDIGILRDFASLSDAEKAQLAQWQRVLYAPLHTGDHLVGVLALGPKQLGELYTQHDFTQLDELLRLFSPLLAQASNLAVLQQVNAFAFAQNQALARERQHLQALASLFNEFMQHISPLLKEPNRQVNEKVMQLHGRIEDPPLRAELDAIKKQLNDAEAPIDKLIHAATRLQERQAFAFQPVQLDEIARKAQRQLSSMATARRVRVELENGPAPPPVMGDPTQLTEAISHLLHNAIKYNKIGGVVNVTCGTTGSSVFLRVLDTGVGIPEDRLDAIWNGFPTIAHNDNGHGRKSSLSLTIVRFIIAAHGGRLDVNSRYGSGSVFEIILPLALEA